MERYVTRRDDFARGTFNEVKHTEVEEDDCELDSLFLVHSDISSVLHQIDELVVKAAKVKTLSKRGRSEVESFRVVMSDMLSSLKPWFPRLQKAISDSQLLTKYQEEQSLVSSSSLPLNEVVDVGEELFDVESPEPTEFEPLVSPSPLVSWRGDHNVEKGRQLFLLTPLPVCKSEFLKHQNASKITSKKNFTNAAANKPLEASKETSDGVLGNESMKGLGNSLESEALSSPILRRKIESELLMTPCLKMSPPKSCILFKPVPESSSRPGKQGDCKSTSSELGASISNGSQSSGSVEADDLCSKYPELLGIHHAPLTRITDLESSPVWWFSPPKTCVLLEPENEKKPNIKPEEEQRTKEGNMSMVVESTPLLKQAESVMSKNRTKAGESTLKKELWTRFEEASLHEDRFSSMTMATTTIRGNKKKGFMEMLEEVCGDEES